MYVYDLSATAFCFKKNAACQTWCMLLWINTFWQLKTTQAPYVTSSTGVVGVTVSMVAFQAVDPGLTTCWRIVLRMIQHRSMLL